MAKQSIGYNDVLTELKHGQFKPVYMLTGEEDYYIDRLTEFFEDNILDESQKEFDLTTIYANKYTTMGDIIMAAKRYPVMSKYQIVIVKEAQNLQKDYDLLAKYLEQPLLSTLLVFCYKHGTFNGKTSAAKAINKVGTFFVSERIYEDRLPTWLTNYAKTQNVTIQPGAAKQIVENVGTDMTTLIHTLDKLKIKLKDGESTITEKLVNDNIGINRDFNIFDLQKAIVKHDIVKAYLIIEHTQQARDFSLQAFTPLLFRLFSNLMFYHSALNQRMSKEDIASALKINPYFLGEYEEAAKHYPEGKCKYYIRYIREAEVQSKGYGISSNRTSYDILRELVYKIFHK